MYLQSNINFFQLLEAAWEPSVEALRSPLSAKFWSQLAKIETLIPTCGTKIFNFSFSFPCYKKNKIFYL